MIYYGLIGTGGHGREIMPVFADLLSNQKHEYSLMFVVEGNDLPKKINGYNVISLDDYLSIDGERYFNIAIANSQARERIAKTCLDNGLKPFPIISRHSIVLEPNEIAEGIMLSPFSIITVNTKIGRFFHANIYAKVSHDCVIGDFVTFAPSAQCNGNIWIEDHAYIGAGALLKNGSKDQPLIVGKGAIIGMGAVVINNVPPYTIVAGNPAKIITNKIN